MIGSNEADKTTLFNIMSGFVTSTLGGVIFEGKQVHDLPPYHLTEISINRTFQNIRLLQERISSRWELQASGLPNWRVTS